MLKLLWLAILLAVNLLTVVLVIDFEYHHLHDENHLFENLQVLLLGLGVLACTVLVRGPGQHPFVWSGLGLLAFSLLLREIDLDQLPLPWLLQALGTGEGRALLLGPLWLAWGAGFLLLQQAKWRYVLSIVLSPVFACQCLALLLLVASALVDRKLLDLAHPRLAEELLEVNAYAFLIWPALYQLRERRQSHFPG